MLTVANIIDTFVPGEVSIEVEDKPIFTGESEHLIPTLLDAEVSEVYRKNGYATIQIKVPELTLSDKDYRYIQINLWGSMPDNIVRQFVDLVYSYEYTHRLRTCKTAQDIVQAIEESWYVYKTMDELIEDERERGGWTDSIVEAATWAYKQIGKTIFRLPNGWVCQYM